MKKFIIGFGSFLKNDLVMYNLFKWIMLNFNKVFIISVMIINILIYNYAGSLEVVSVNGRELLNISSEYKLLFWMNILLSIIIIGICVWNLIDDYVFDTDKYENYFYEIEK